MNAIEELKKIVDPRGEGQCPACGYRGVWQAGWLRNPALCESCGHFFIIENGKSRNLTKAEMQVIRQVNRESGGKGQRRQRMVTDRICPND